MILRFMTLCSLCAVLLMTAPVALAAASAAASVKGLANLKDVVAVIPEGGAVTVQKAVLLEGESCVRVVLTNTGKIIDALVGVSSSVAPKAVLVDQRMHRDVAKVELLPNIPLSIEPGASCIILRGANPLPKAGDNFAVELKFMRAPAQSVTVKVLAQGAGSGNARAVAPPVLKKEEGKAE